MTQVAFLHPDIPAGDDVDLSDTDWDVVLRLAVVQPSLCPRACVLLAAQGADPSRAPFLTSDQWTRVPSSRGGPCRVKRGATRYSSAEPVHRTPLGHTTAKTPDPIVHLVGHQDVTVFDRAALTVPPDIRPVRPDTHDAPLPETVRAALEAVARSIGYDVVTDSDVGKLIRPAAALTDHLIRRIWISPDSPRALQVQFLAGEVAEISLLAGADDEPLSDIAPFESWSTTQIVLTTLGIATTGDVPPVPTDDPAYLAEAAERVITAARSMTDRLAGVDPHLRSALAAPDRDAEPEVAFERIGGGRHRDAAPSGASIATPTGVWELSWSGREAAFNARHLDTGDGPGGGVVTSLSRLKIQSLGRLEEHLGFALPHRVRTYLASIRASDPPRASHPPPSGRTPPAIGLDLRPAPFSLVTVPGKSPIGYQAALSEHPPIHHWSSGDAGRRCVVEILDAARTARGAATAGAQPETSCGLLTYRVSLNGVVVFSDDDIETPAHALPEADETIREVVTLLTWIDPDIPLTPRQVAFVDEYGELLRAQVAEPSAPYPTGTRVRVTDGDRETTGVVVEAISSDRPAPSDDAPSPAVAYAWRPDISELPGHPWATSPQHTLVSTAEAVTPTLATPAHGLPALDEHMPLAYRAEVCFAADHGLAIPAMVLRARVSSAGLVSYDVRSIDAPRPGQRRPELQVPEHDIVPVRGTAWPSIRALAEARAADDVPLQAGELLSAAGQVARVDATPDGITITRVLAARDSTSAADHLPDRSHCATPDCTQAPEVTVSVGWPDGPRELTDRCRRCGAGLAAARLSRGCAVDLQPLPPPIPTLPAGALPAAGNEPPDLGAGL
jgi:hypothetical protein